MVVRTQTHISSKTKLLSVYPACPLFPLYLLSMKYLHVERAAPESRPAWGAQRWSGRGPGFLYVGALPPFSSLTFSTFSSVIFTTLSSPNAPLLLLSLPTVALLPLLPEERVVLGATEADLSDAMERTRAGGPAPGPSSHL